MDNSQQSISLLTPYYIEDTHTEQSSLFLKYKEGKALPNAPFKLFEFHASTSADESSETEQPRKGVRGPYRKYSC